MTNGLLNAAMYEKGRADALALQDNVSTMTGDELNESTLIIPKFKEAVKVKNMMDRKAGRNDGFVCVSPIGNVVMLLQNYDSDVYTADPEELLAQWRFWWSTDPAKAKPFIKDANSPYDIGHCCIWEGEVHRSKMNNNVYSPDEYPDGWEKVNG